MFCGNCGTKSVEGNRFCVACSALPTLSGQDGTPNVIGSVATAEEPDAAVPETMAAAAHRPSDDLSAAAYKLAVVAEYEAASYEEKTAVLHREGIQYSQIREWAAARDAGVRFHAAFTSVGDTDFANARITYANQSDRTGGAKSWTTSQLVSVGLLVAVVGAILATALWSVSSGSTDAASGLSNANVHTAGQSVQFGTADITMTRTASMAPRAYVYFQIESNSDGGLCPTSNDVYLLTSAGERWNLAEAPGNCTSLNAGEKGKVSFASPLMTGPGQWPKGSVFVFAPDQGPVVARWAADGTSAASAG